MFAHQDWQVTFIFGSLLKPFLWFQTFFFLCRGRRLDLKHFIVFNLLHWYVVCTCLCLIFIE